MRAADDHVFEFADFILAPGERLLLYGGKPIPLTAKAFDLLVTLVQHAGRLVTKDDLLRMVWPNTVVEEVNLTVNISALRRALGRSASGKKLIQTVPTRGYRFVGSAEKKRGPAVVLARHGSSLRAATATSSGDRERGRIPRLSSRPTRMESEVGAWPEAGDRELPTRRLH
jgi:DNA-binding winged helix-turn-helix (wHTH) protein